MNLFGKKKVQAPVAPKENTVETIKSLRAQLETLEKRRGKGERRESVGPVRAIANKLANL